MYKKDLVNIVSTATGETKIKTELFISTFLSAIEDALIDGEKVSIVGFGTFETKEIKGKDGVAFGKPYTSEDRKSVKFSAYDTLKEKISK